MRRCAICEKPPREGELMLEVRLRPGNSFDKKPALYSSCQECAKKALTELARERGVPPDQLSFDDLT